MQEGLLGRRGAAVATVAVAAAVSLGAGLASGRAPRSAPIGSRFALANRCVALGAMGGAPRFYFKPTGLGTYILYGQDRKLLAAVHGRIIRTASPGASTEWRRYG